jgi:hypothetical protein
MLRMLAALSKLFVAMLLGLACAFCAAQTFRGSINGTISDQSGAVLPNVPVTATSATTGIVHTAATSSAGEFLFQDLPVGEYFVQANSSGFQGVKIDHVPVSSGAIYTLKITLHPAQTTTSVEVSADQVGLDTASSTELTILPTKAVQDLPQNGRDVSQLVAQSPGFAGAPGLGGGGLGSVNGTRPNAINWQIEGTDDNDLFWGYPSSNISGASGIATTLIPVEAIDQFSFVTSSGAQTGRNAGGTVNLTLKSGTNQLHGSAFYYIRNEFFAANTPFAPSGSKKQYLRNINDGGSLGGPIIKNKTFGFAAFEYQGFGIANTSSSTEPSTAYQAAATDLLSFYGMTVSPVATSLLANLWPADALTGPASPANYFNRTIARGYSYNGVAKIDHNINQKNNLSVRAFYGYGHAESPGPSYLTPFWAYGPQRSQNYAITDNMTLTAHLTNQLSFGTNIVYLFFTDKDTNFDPVALGLNTGVTNPSLSGAPRIQITNFDPIGWNPPYGRKTFVPQLTDTVTYVKASHQMSFGGEYRWARYTDLTQRYGRGSFVYDGSQGPWSSSGTACSALATINQSAPSPVTDQNTLDLADFMAGCAATAYIAQGDQTRNTNLHTFSLFGQDAWQMKKTFTLNFGLRYEYFGPPHDASKDLSVFNPNVAGGLAVAGQDIANIFPQYKKGFNPRVGFAYSPGKSTFAIRGSYGLYFDTPHLQLFFDLRGTNNGGTPGVADNPVGTKPVAFPSLNSVIIQPNVPIFPTLGQSIAGESVINVFSINPNFQPGVTSNYNLNIQQSLGHFAVAQIGYVGTQGRHLTTVVDINQAAQGSAQANPTCDAKYASAGEGNQQCSRPYFTKFPNFAVINQVQSGADSNFNSLQTSLRVAGWRGVSGQANYMWSHSLDFMTGIPPYLPQDSTNLKAEYGNSDMDTRHQFTAYLTYDVPGSKHGPSWLSHGWQFNGIFNFHSGQPFTVMSTNNSSGNGEFSDRANLVPGMNPFQGVSHKVVDGAVQWFNTDAFVDPPDGQYGTSRRGQYTNPGYSEVDFSAFKNTHISERVTLQLRAEMFNLFNRINLAPVGYPQIADSAGEGNSGQIFSTFGAFFAEQGIGPGEPFNTQFAIKVIF